MFYNHNLSFAFNNPENPLKWKTLFGPASRKDMAAEIGMEKMNFNNNMKVLRDKEIITYDSIMEQILIDPYDVDKQFNVNFKFKINTDETIKNEVSKNGQNV